MAPLLREFMVTSENKGGILLGHFWDGVLGLYGEILRHLKERIIVLLILVLLDEARYIYPTCHDHKFV